MLQKSGRNDGGLSPARAPADGGRHEGQGMLTRPLRSRGLRDRGGGHSVGDRTGCLQKGDRTHLNDRRAGRKGLTGKVV